MANLVTNQLQLTILSTEDSTNNVLVNRSCAPQLDEFVADFTSYAKTPDGVAHSLTTGGQVLGFASFSHVYVRNLAAAGSLAVLIKPNGGAGAAVVTAILGPGDVFVYWQGSVGAVAIGGVIQGLADVQVQGSAAGIVFEYFLGD